MSLFFFKLSSIAAILAAILAACWAMPGLQVNFLLNAVSWWPCLLHSGLFSLPQNLFQKIYLWKVFTQRFSLHFFFQLSLQVFNISGNNLDSIRELTILRMITQFIACDNQLSDMKEVAHCLTAWPAIWRLDLQGNPICMKSKYRDRIIIMAPKLGKIKSKISLGPTSCQIYFLWLVDPSL